MPWPRFLIWNALGRICRATSVSLLAYTIGSQAGNATQAIGAVGIAMLILIVLGHFAWRRLRGSDRTAIHDNPVLATQKQSAKWLGHRVSVNKNGERSAPSGRLSAQRAVRAVVSLFSAASVGLLLPLLYADELRGGAGLGAVV